MQERLRDNSDCPRVDQQSPNSNLIKYLWRGLCREECQNIPKSGSETLQLSVSTLVSSFFFFLKMHLSKLIFTVTFYFLKKKKKITLNIHSHQAEENPGLRKSKWTEASWVTGESPGETKVEKLKKVQLFSRIRL